MKLGEALTLRKDTQLRAQRLVDRLKQNAQIQEGEKPDEDAASLVQELERLADELALLVARINRTNPRPRYRAARR